MNAGLKTKRNVEKSHRQYSVELVIKDSGMVANNQENWIIRNEPAWTRLTVTAKSGLERLPKEKDS